MANEIINEGFKLDEDAQRILESYIQQQLEKNNGKFVTEYIVSRDQVIEWMKKYQKYNKEE